MTEEQFKGAIEHVSDPNTVMLIILSVAAWVESYGQAKRQSQTNRLVAKIKP